MQLTAIRIDDATLERVDELADKLKRKRSSVLRELIGRGLATIEDSPLNSQVWVTREEVQEMIDTAIRTAIGSSPKPTATKGINKNKEEALNEIHANGWLTSEELCERIKRSFGDISRKSGSMSKEEFANFTKELDPDGVAWEKLPDKIGKFAVYKQIDV